MKQALMALAILAFGAGAFAAAPPPVAVPDGLVAVAAHDLDQVYLRPGTDLGGFRRVMIDPVAVEFDRDWLDNLNDRRRAPYVRQSEVRRIAEEMGSSFLNVIAESFKARGYEIVTSPTPGTLRLSPRIRDLRINATEILPPGTTRAFTRDDAGEATLALEARDAVSGAVVGVMADHREARTTPRVTQATDVSNRYWFDAMYRRFASNAAAALNPRKPT